MLANQSLGLFIFDFDFVFSDGAFDADRSGFSVASIQSYPDGLTGRLAVSLRQRLSRWLDDARGLLGDTDNVDWTSATTLNGVVYDDGLVFVNEDNDDGEIWMRRPDGSGLVQIGDTEGIDGATESTGILDISALVGYYPGSILLTNNQGANSSLTVLINPHATVNPYSKALSED